MTAQQRLLKRSFDVVVAGLMLLTLWPFLVIGWIVAARSTKAGGLFTQTRIGQHGKPFTVYKLQTMRPASGGSFVTTTSDARITPAGLKLRKLKLDELPQLVNVLRGDMSLVGPRPDVAGYMDRLSGDDRRLLALRPGITGPATLKYRNEEDILDRQSDPQTYNDTVIWPDKVRINLDYLDNWSLRGDMKIMLRTVIK